MKNSILAIVVLLISLFSISAISQNDNEEDLLGLPGDNLDLFAVLNLFQKSPTIEAFEKTLNDSATGINNLDLNIDDKIDFIKVTTEQKDEDFNFILQVDVTEKETQDVAVILLSKDKEDKVTLQIVGDKDLYGKDYVIEPAPATPAVTPNPAYAGNEPVPEAAPASSTVVVVESAPIVQYVYSPVYVPYYPPYHYGYYPPYFRAAAVISIGIYRHNNYYHHHGYRGGYGNTVVIHNHNNYNNYNNHRNSSNTVNHHKNNGNYNRGNRPSNGSGNRPSGGGDRPSQQPTKPGASTRPSNPSASQQPANRPSSSDRYTSPSPSTREASGSGSRQQGASPSTRQSGNTRQSTSPSTRQSTSPSSRQSASPSTRQSSSRQSSGSYSGGGRSGGSSSSGRSGGGRSGGGRR